MKKMKKIAALLLAMAMVMGMSLTAFAAKTGASIVVKGLSTAGKQTVKIYEIYRLDDNDNLWQPSDWAKTILTSPDDLNNTEKIASLATAVTDTVCIATQESTTGTVTFSETDALKLQAGAYLVIATDSTNQTVYNPMVAVTYDYDANNLIKATTATVTAKANSYTITKTQKDDDAVVAVGDLIPYEIRTTIPYVADGTANKTLVITDTLTGAIYDTDKADFTLTVGGNKVENIQPVVKENKAGFTLTLDSLVGIANENAGKEVVITYKAVVTAVDEITNTASSNRVTDENGEEIPTTPTENYTGQITITKVNESNEVLKGAEFVLYRINENGKKEYAEISNSYITGVWHIENEDGSVPTGAGKVVTNDNGTYTVKGLDVGTYYFKETVAPDGYSINATDVAGEITKTEKDSTVEVKGSATMTDTKLTNLPSTGGIGTTIFTIGGCLIMIVAAGLFFATRKKSAK